MFKLLLLTLGLTSVPGFRLRNLKEPLVVTIKNGQILGTSEITSRESKEYFAFKGIPYAKPPVKELRFKPPVPIDNWEGTLNTTQFANYCIQVAGNGGVEDCLYINVFTPDLEKKYLPVMVWIYGGAFITGKSNNFQPDFFLEEDVIVVTLNYRIGALGFFTTGDEVVSGNAGLKDQILALKWVQDNIEFFGGDPEAVTVFGQSAGSVSVSYLLQTELTTGLFRAAIMESGSSLNLWALSRNKEKIMKNVAKFFNITTTNSQEMVDGLQGVNPHFLTLIGDLAESVTMVLGNPLHGLSFSPTTESEVEGAVVTGHSYEKLVNGRFQKVPVILGFNSEEANMFEDETDLVKFYLLENQIVTNRFTPIDMNVDESNFDLVGKLIYDEYFPKGMLNSSTSDIFRFISESQFEKPIYKMAELYSKHVPTYFYRFSYYEEGSHIVPGAAHNDEMSYLWANENRPNHPLTKKMVKLWTNFAKTTNPTPEVDAALDNVLWESFGYSNKYLNIDETLVITDKDVNTRMKFWHDLYEKYANPPFDTY